MDENRLAEIRQRSRGPESWDILRAQQDRLWLLEQVDALRQKHEETQGRLQRLLDEQSAMDAVAKSIMKAEDERTLTHLSEGST